VSIFNRFFNKKEPISPVSISQLQCDFHSHLIPGIDDGVKELQEAVDILGCYAQMGFQKVITTPHIMCDFYRNTPDIIWGGLQKVREELKEQGIKLTLEAAAEYYVDFDFEQKIETEKLLTFGDNYVLIEISYLNEPENLNRVMFNLQIAGYKVILAHPERYPFWFGKKHVFETLVNNGIYLQMNMNSLTGMYSPEVKKQAEFLVNNQWIKFIGSDCHSMSQFEYFQQLDVNPFFMKLLESGKLLNATL